jgi:feruloyl esterase
LKGQLLPARLFVLAAILPAVGSCNAISSSPADLRCARLAHAKRPEIEILSAKRVPGGPSAVPGQDFNIPASCRLVGVARPTKDSRITFELWLPDGWSGRYAQLGNGGFAGNIDHASLANEIRRGNAAAMTDTGHKASQFDASWALGHPEKVVDYGYRSIEATADSAKWLIEYYYGQRPTRRYFVGCSNGGRQALMAAQRYPDDWDGIIAGSPPVQWTRQLATFAAIQHRLRSDQENWIPAGKLPAIARAALEACDSVEQSPADPQCRLDTRRLLCRGADAPGCLTGAQAATLNLIQSGPQGGPSGPFYFGFDPTGAALAGNWDQWIVNPDRNAPSQLVFATQAFRYLILDRPDWQIEDFDPKRDLSRASERKIAGRRLSALLDPDDPDLSRFRKHGGKIIMYVGSADPVISPAAGVAYYRDVVKRAGGVDQTRSFFRAFVVPGMQHCQGGLAPNAFGQAWVAPALIGDPRQDIRLALEAWVERDRPPDSIIAAKYDNDRSGGRLVATRELRAYPAAAGVISRVR